MGLPGFWTQIYSGSKWEVVHITVFGLRHTSKLIQDVPKFLFVDPALQNTGNCFPLDMRHVAKRFAN
jgi:hypothetical protein